MTVSESIETANTDGDEMKIISRIKQFSPPKYVFYISYALFAVLFIVVSCFHERWFDEANAWLLARSCTFYELVFKIPKAEGHPPLWWLILSVPAKLGADFTVSMTVTALIPSLINTYLIMFRAPFPPVVRIMIPFTFYSFFQCGIMTRPYGLMTMAFLLAAIFYDERDKKPFRFAAALMLMCMTSAYGIIIAGGIAAVWCIKMIASEKLTDIIRSRRFPALLMLLLCALLLVYLLSGAENTPTNYAAPQDAFSAFSAVVFMFTAAPAFTVFIGTNSQLISPAAFLSESIVSLLPIFISGVLVMAVMILFMLKKKRLTEFIVPYILFAGFCAFYYWYMHHTAIIWMLFLYSVWIAASADSTGKADFLSAPKCEDALNLTFSAAICMMLVWNVFSSVCDITSSYACSRDIAIYLEKHGLKDSHILASGSWYAVPVECYLGRSIEYKMDEDSVFKDFRLVDTLASDHPEVLIGETSPEPVYDIAKTEYILVYTAEHIQAFKLMHTAYYDSVYLRRDLFDRYPDVHPKNPEDEEFIVHDLS